MNFGHRKRASIWVAIRKLQGKALHVSPAGSVGASADGSRQRSPPETRTPSEGATASFDSLMDVKSAFALLLTKVTKLET